MSVPLCNFHINPGLSMNHYLNIFITFILSILTFHNSSSLFAEEEDIVVCLETDCALVPLYFPPTIQEQALLEDSYIQQLEKILSFDLAHNGSTYLAKRTAANNEQASGSTFDNFGSIENWKNQNIFFVVKARIKGKSISLSMLDVAKKSLKNTDEIPLTGNLNEDRRQLHRLADIVHKAFFNTNGIATTHILYTLRIIQGNDSKKWVSEIWEADYDGANPRPITQERSYCISPIYMPPKTGFATGGFLYVSYQLGQPKIYIASLKDGKGHRLTYLKGNQLMPAISFQRDKIAFISDVTGNPDLFLQPFSPEKGAEGKPQQIFSAKQATQGSPTFSPDGKKIAFVSNKDGSPKIYVIAIPQPGTSLKNIQANLITKRNRENSAPTWSPDGTKIAYCARHGGDRQIWVYDFATNQERQITQGKGNKENPSWAPNSLHLVYNSSDTNKSELYLINLNQSDAIQISTGPGEKRFPSWEPR